MYIFPKQSNCADTLIQQTKQSEKHLLQSIIVEKHLFYLSPGKSLETATPASSHSI